MHIMKSSLSLLALAAVVVAFAPSSHAQPISSSHAQPISSSHAQPIRGKRSVTDADAVRATATRKCSTAGFASAKE
jgi:hypothetical protein